MRSARAGIIGGLLGVALAALAFGACSHNADDCRNTKTCIPPPCDGGMLDGSGDCCETEDGGFVCGE